jgi:putative flippase GtrA
MKRIKELIIKYKEILLYLIFGVLTTAVSIFSFWLFSLFIPERLYLITNVISWVIAVIFAFVTNKLFVFKSKSFAFSVAFPELTKFLSARILTGVLEMAGVPLLVSLGLGMTIFGIEGAVAKIIVTIAVIILNYVFSKLFIFKKQA